MKVAIRADDGDEVTVVADEISVEQSVVRLRVDNLSFRDESAPESITLPVEQALKLVVALKAAIEMIEGALYCREGLR